MRWTVTPVTGSPRRNVQNTGSGPRPAGRSEGWTLRMPSGGISRAARGSRQGKQAATATSGATLRIVSVASAADFTQTTGMPVAVATRWISPSRIPGLPREDDRRDHEPGLDQRRQGRHRRGARLTEEEDARDRGHGRNPGAPMRHALCKCKCKCTGKPHGRSKIAGDEEPEKLTRSVRSPTVPGCKCKSRMRGRIDPPRRDL